VEYTIINNNKMELQAIDWIVYIFALCLFSIFLVFIYYSVLIGVCIHVLADLLLLLNSYLFS
jgi:hypothetical protein